MDPFLGEIRINSFPFAPKGWAKCDGAILPVNQNTALFSLLGGAFGGNGSTTFGLPDFRGRSLMGISGSNVWGSAAGTETVALTAATIPAHSHMAKATTDDGNQPTPSSGIFAASPAADNFPLYGTAATGLTAIAPTTISSAGAGVPHPNMQPFLVLNFCVALAGIYPSRQ